jgi:hypothetical protein
MADTFPRSKDLPAQSPLFWVEQKDRYLRQILIRDIEELTKRRLVIDSKILKLTLEILHLFLNC